MSSRVVASVAPRVGFPAACAAPFVSLHLDPHGAARVCCENRMHVIGRVPDTSLQEIWHGEPLRALRDAIRRGDLDLGCDGCRWGLESGQRADVRAGLYDDLVVDDPAPDRPVRLELELSNACNLQCVMCNGELSSSIRSRREHRPPLPTVYHDEFFDDLAALAPTLQQVLFLGGEPFLGAESLRAFDVLAANGFRGGCHVTTNGTIAGDRVAAILERLRPDVSMSVDGWTAGTLERIRVGVSHDALYDNIEWFADRVRSYGGVLAFHFCLMRSNWHELHDLMVWADSMDAEVVVLAVTHPMHLSLAQLPPRELADIRSRMVAQAAAGAPLTRNAHSWQVAVSRLVVAGTVGVGAVPVDLRSGGSVGSSPAAAVDDLRRWADGRGMHELVVDADGLILEVRPAPEDALGMDLRSHLGSHSQLLLDALRNRFGELARAVQEEAPAGVEDRWFHFDGPEGPTTVRALLIVAEDGDDVWYLAARPGHEQAPDA